MGRRRLPLRPPSPPINRRDVGASLSAALCLHVALPTSVALLVVFVEGMRCALVVLRIAFLLLVVAAYQLIAPLFPHWLPPPSHIRAVRRSEMDNLAESVEHYD